MYNSIQLWLMLVPTFEIYVPKKNFFLVTAFCSATCQANMETAVTANIDNISVKSAQLSSSFKYKLTDSKNTWEI